MKIKTVQVVFLLSTAITQIIAIAIPINYVHTEPEYVLEAYKENSNPPTLYLRIQPKHGIPSSLKNDRRPRQDEDEEENSQPSAPASAPFIPPVLPALTKILTGILTGNLNEIFHGSTLFAPQNVSYAIDTVYNNVVGLPPPKRPTTPQPLVVETTPEPSTLPPAPETTRRAIVTNKPSIPSSSLSYLPGNPVGSSGSIVFTTRRSTSTEDDEDEAGRK